ERQERWAREVGQANAALARRIERTLTRRPHDPGARRQAKAGQAFVRRARAKARRRNREAKQELIRIENARLAQRLGDVTAPVANKLGGDKHEKAQKRRQLPPRHPFPRRRDTLRATAAAPAVDLAAVAVGRRRDPILDPLPSDIPKAMTLAKERRNNGIYVEKGDRLRVFQSGRAIDGLGAVVSVFESTLPGQDALEIEVFEQKSCKTHSLVVNGRTVQSTFGLVEAQELVAPHRRQDLCRALADKLRFFPLNGQAHLVLTSFMSFGTRSSQVLAEKRALFSKLERVRHTSGPAIPRSLALKSTLEDLTLSAEMRGKPFPSTRTRQLKRPVGVLPEPSHSKPSDLVVVNDDDDISEPPCSSPSAPPPNDWPGSDVLEHRHEDPSVDTVEFEHDDVCSLRLRFAWEPLSDQVSIWLMSDEKDWVACSSFFPRSVLVKISLDACKQGRCTDRTLRALSRALR
ncbi:unnamed protein product, partial [Durusdinium trenchii]